MRLCCPAAEDRHGDEGDAEMPLTDALMKSRHGDWNLVPYLRNGVRGGSRCLRRLPVSIHPRTESGPSPDLLPSQEWTNCGTGQLVTSSGAGERPPSSTSSPPLERDPECQSYCLLSQISDLYVAWHLPT